MKTPKLGRVESGKRLVNVMMRILERFRDYLSSLALAVSIALEKHVTVVIRIAEV